MLAAAVLAADQASKWIVLQRVTRLPWRLTDGLRLELHRNAGISFSRLSDAGELVIVMVAAVCACVTAALVLAPPRYRPAIGLLLGGALGNLVDRLARGGAVIDFIGVYSYPTFNIADIAIVGGTAIMVVQVLRDARR